MEASTGDQSPLSTPGLVYSNYSVVYYYAERNPAEKKANEIIVATLFLHFTHERVISDSGNRHKVFKMTLKNCHQSNVLWAALCCPEGS